MAKDFLIDDNGNFIIEDGDFKIGDSELQEVAEILTSNPGEFKEDPLIGAGLVKMMKSKYDSNRLISQIKVQLKRDGKDYEDYSQIIKVIINGTHI